MQDTYIICREESGYVRQHKRQYKRANIDDMFIYCSKYVSNCAGVYILILETRRGQYEIHNTPLGHYTDQGP